MQDPCRARQCAGPVAPARAPGQYCAFGALSGSMGMRGLVQWIDGLVER